jgi:hypothetical protein
MISNPFFLFCLNASAGILRASRCAVRIGLVPICRNSLNRGVRHLRSLPKNFCEVLAREAEGLKGLDPSSATTRIWEVFYSGVKTPSPVLVSTTRSK